jgi:hypothetical protein
MRARRTLVTMRLFGLVSVAALALCGCSYDYIQHTDRVTYGAGDAVQSNIQSETLNPEKPSNNDTSGLGKNGEVDPAAATTH